MSVKPISSAGRGGQELNTQPITVPAAKIGKHELTVVGVESPSQEAVQQLLPFTFTVKTLGEKGFVPSRKRHRAERIAPSCPL